MKILVLIFVAVAIPMATFAGNGEEMTKILGVKLGNDTTLRDVEKRFGKGRVIETGEAGEYKATVCYYVPKCQTKVEFWSDELGGDNHDVIGFTLTRTKKNVTSCPVINASCEELHLANGLKLGMKKIDFTKMLGSGIESVEGFYQKGFESRKPLTEKERLKMSKTLSSAIASDLIWDIVVFVRGAFNRGGLDILQVSKTQTF